ncbi:zinc finger FYVE domain-containing protein 21-like isoform X2 [Antedon mediterranea]|uniref:zinc finger FYVE domain-containing protein 21-like isoform X2 n=1 Tax=Antedon mediterranea TaxID=105859 RepID=UPI003AF65FC8
MASDSGKQLVKSKSGLRMISIEEKDNSPFQLLEPPWVPDMQSKECIKCHSKFDLMKRRHHCRRCGLCFCNVCCASKVGLPRMNFVDPVRMCSECSVVTKKENEFYDKHLKCLITGSFFMLSAADADEDNIVTYVKLTANHRTIMFNEEKPDRESTKTSRWVYDPVDMINIQNLNIETTGDTSHAVLKYKYLDNSKEVILKVPDDNSKKQSMAWIVALQKAVKMLMSSKET